MGALGSRIGSVGGLAGWFFAAGSAQGDFGLRAQAKSGDFRACSPGGFFGGGRTDKKHWHHIAYTIVPEEGVYRPKCYLDGKLNDSSPQLFDKLQTLTSARIGSAAHGGEWRLNETLIDDFRLYNVGMTDGQISRLASEGGEAGAPAGEQASGGGTGGGEARGGGRQG